MLATGYIIGFLGMIVLPALFAFWLVRKYRLSWKLLLAGALTFIASQVLHIPLVLGITNAFQTGALPHIPQTWALTFNAVLLGLLAGIFEETARYLLFKFILRKERSWEEGLVVGAGHGGIEAILIGVSAALAFFTMVGYRSVDLSTIPSIPPEQVEAARQQVEAYWTAPGYIGLLGLLERVFAMCLHLSLSVMVLFSVARKQPIWFWLALLWHAFVDAAAVYLVAKISPLGVEATIGLMAVISLGILFWLRGQFPKAEAEPAATPA